MSVTRAMTGRSNASGDRAAATAVPVDSALRWLSRSGIIVSDSGNPDCGAVYSFFDAGSGRHRLVYAEGTGYLLSFWKYLRATNRAGDLEGRARAAGDWLVRWAARHGAIVAMGIDGGAPVGQAYAFDNGVCAKGLLDLYEVCGERRYVDAARNILQRVLDDFLSGDGSLKAAVDLSSGQPLGSDRVWYTASGGFHAKVSMPLLQLFALTGDPRLIDSARRICAWTLCQQAADGSFPANVTMRDVHLHAHCYATEALFYAYAALGDVELREAAQRAVRWILSRQAASGSITLWHGARLLKRRASYAMAQAVRLFLLSYALTRQTSLIDAATRTAAFLQRMQASSDDPRIDGGFYAEDIVRRGLLIRKNREVTSWATMFAIQALDLLPKIRQLSFEQCARWLF